MWRLHEEEKQRKHESPRRYVYQSNKIIVTVILLKILYGQFCLRVLRMYTCKKILFLSGGLIWMSVDQENLQNGHQS